MFLNPMTVGVLFLVLWVLLTVPAGVCLMLCYQKTRMSGFIWLFVSLVAWPIVARGLTLTVNTMAPLVMANRGLPASRYMNGMMAFSLVETLIGGTLLLVSSIILYRQIVERTAPAATPMESDAAAVVDERR